MIKNILNSSIFGMSHIKRYSGTRVNHSENLAEHSYYVSILSDIITQDIKKKFPKKEIDELKVLKFALYHDFEEIVTGDVITPVKYQSEVLRKELERVGSELLTEMLNTEFDSKHEHIKRNIKSSHNSYEIYKGVNLENKIVKFSDMLQSFFYCVEEVNSGNLNFKTVLATMIESLIEKWGRTKYFRPYIEEVLEIAKEGKLTMQSSEIDIFIEKLSEKK